MNKKQKRKKKKDNERRKKTCITRMKDNKTKGKGTFINKEGKHGTIKKRTWNKSRKEQN